MTNLVALKALNAESSATCAILPTRQAEVDAVAHKLCAPDAKFRYQAISQAAWGKPDLRFVVAIIQEREAVVAWLTTIIFNKGILISGFEPIDHTRIRYSTL